jgi:hypothetical protein
VAALKQRMNDMKSEAKSLVQDGNKRKYAKTTLRVYGMVGEITSSVAAMKKADAGKGQNMTSTGA